MKADEGAAADGNSRRRAGHHVMVARAVVPLIVADRADHREFVGDRTQPLHVLREPHAGDLRRDRVELAAEFNLTVTNVTNYLASARRDFRKIVLEKLRDLTATDDEFRREARAMLGVDQ